jgi:hypothetical protein
LVGKIRDSLMGNLEPPESGRGPLQLQSQSIVRAAFVRAGLSPTHPTHSPKKGISSPDLIIENGNQTYAIDAKRPQSAKGIEARFDDARVQVSRYGLRGGILVDVTDCLRNLPGKELDAEVRRLALLLYDRVFIEGKGYQSAHSNIMMAGTFARIAWTSDDRAESAIINVHTSSSISIFAERQNTLSDHHSHWIRERFEHGLTSLSRTLSESTGERGA